MLTQAIREELISDLVFFAKHIGRKVDWGYDFDCCSFDLTYYSFFLHNGEIPESYAKGMMEEIEKFNLNKDDLWVRLQYKPSASLELTDSSLRKKSWCFAEFLGTAENDEILVALFEVYRKKAADCITKDLEYITTSFGKYSIA